jgi:hypothetical protein
MDKIEAKKYLESYTDKIFYDTDYDVIGIAKLNEATSIYDIYNVSSEIPYDRMSINDFIECIGAQSFIDFQENTPQKIMLMRLKYSDTIK